MKTTIDYFITYCLSIDVHGFSTLIDTKYTLSFACTVTILIEIE